MKSKRMRNFAEREKKERTGKVEKLITTYSMVIIALGLVYLTINRVIHEEHISSNIIISAILLTIPGITLIFSKSLANFFTRD